MTIDKYLDKLAARSPVPGGGSAAALVGTIGISLLSMVARYIARGSSLPPKISKILKFTERFRQRLRKLMVKDEIAYLRLSKAIESKGSKDISHLYEEAARVPLEVCAVLYEGLKMCEELCSYCKSPIASDLAEAAIIMEAGFLSAELNVKVNLAGIKDTRYSRKIQALLLRQGITVLKAKKRILKWLQR